MFHLPPSLLDESVLLDVIEFLPAGVFAKDQNNDFRFVIWNKEMERIFATPRSDMLGKNDYDFFQPTEADYYRRVDTDVMRGGQVVDIAQETVTTLRGTIIAHTIKVPVTLSDGRRILLGILEDITERVHNREQLAQYQNRLESLVEERTRALKTLASTDMLTGLSNRAYFFEHLEQLIHAEQPTPFSLIYLDLDRFKLVNDTFGHDFGDELLTVFGKRLARLSNAVIDIARIGGDEFAILVDAPIASPTVDQVCRQISEIFSEEFELSERCYSIEGSMGLCGFPEDAGTPRQMLQNADMAMYHAKQARQPQRWERYSARLHQQSMESLEIEQALRYAIERQELRLVYQAQYSATLPQQIVGMEALVRWHAGNLGDIPPGIFIPVAEMTGFIHQITDFVIDTVCRDLARLLAQGIQPPRTSVNISAVELDIHMAERIEAVLARHQIPPSLLTLEITENTKLKGDKDALEHLRPLRTKGLNLSIDDFGTGYSSLAYISELEIDEIKIDRSFIQSSLDNPKHESIVKAIIGIGQAFNYRIVAEGVETAAHMAALQHYEGVIIQGYLLSRPGPLAVLFPPPNTFSTAQ